MTGTLITRLDSLGDVLLTGPAVAAAARGGPVTFACGPRGRAAAAMLSGVDELVVLDTPWIDATPRPVSRAALDAFVTTVAEVAPERAAILGSSRQSPLPTALLLRLAGVAEIAAICRDRAGTLLDHRLPDPGDVHEIERNLTVTAALGFTRERPTADLDLLRDHGARPRGLPDGDYVVVHPGTSVPARAWPPRHHRELVRRLAADGRPVVVTGDAGDRRLTAYVADGHAIDLGGRTSLPALAETLAGASVAVVGNTGPAHLAAAVGTPVASLFAPTVPAARWRPWSVPHELLFLPVACAGCHAGSCPADAHHCMDGVPVDDVLAAIARLAPAPAESADATTVLGATP